MHASHVDPVKMEGGKYNFGRHAFDIHYYAAVVETRGTQDAKVR